MPARRIGDLSPERTHYWNGDIWGWQPLWLTPDAVTAIAGDRFGLRATDATYLGSGLLNQSWRLDTADGAFILRVSRPERTRAQIAWEHAVVRRLHEEIAAVIAPLPGCGGETIQTAQGFLFSLFPFAPGTSGVDVPATIRARASAEMLARIHRFTAGHLRLPQRPGFHSIDERPRWVWPEVKPILAGTFGGSAEFASFSAAIEREIAALDRWLDALQAAGRLTPRAVVHGDFNPRNLIFLGDRLAAVIDWDDCHVAPVAWEVARAAYAPDVDPPAFWRDYLASDGPLIDEDVAMLDGFARVGALSELQWTLDEHDQPTPHAPQQLRDVARNLDRLRRRASP
jgi:Ser/Thr protein kinase RdoA (MazF antagonist)